MRRRAFRLTNRARRDLAEIRSFVAADSPNAADRLLSQISEKIAWAAESGYTGVPRNFIRPGLRALQFGNYCIYFIVDQNFLTVLRILHGAREVGLQSFSEDG